jgi:antitoxin HicB
LCLHCRAIVPQITIMDKVVRRHIWAHIYKIPLMLTSQSEGGYTVTSSVLPELITEEDTVEEALAHVQDALVAVVELYEDLGKPDTILGDPDRITFEYPVTVA